MGCRVDLPGAYWDGVKTTPSTYYEWVELENHYYNHYQSTAAADRLIV
ncbi:OrfB [Renibacterium salmoninarum ATCC 33209]|uniref:OrfB n=1 Tax=Renibacterium salmoninarum (strain ATCC 33209 / DSM 20767 / JCM 11484 / NBRC 15589 / NCIMB 2235) TaxID=288705 RepID=A9WN74_RENSM|nr:OrfB [Renibacterium salmoninarum ATCC 33209]